MRQDSETDDTKLKEAELQRAGLERWIQGLEQGEETDYVNPPYPKDDIIRVSMTTTKNTRKLLPLLEEEEEEEEESRPSAKSRCPVILPTVTLGFTAEEEGSASTVFQQPRVPKKLVPVVAGFRVERWVLCIHMHRCVCVCVCV